MTPIHFIETSDIGILCLSALTIFIGAAIVRVGIYGKYLGRLRLVSNVKKYPEEPRRYHRYITAAGGIVFILLGTASLIAELVLLHMRAATSALRMLLLITLVVISAGMASAQQLQTVTITEPAVVTLANLYKQADTVVVAKIVAGDDENYKTAVYKAEVVKSFKGAATGSAIYFGPYVGERLGWEYVLFLRSTPQPVAPKTTSSVSYGTVRYSEIFEEGYSSMMKSYECVFGGAGPTHQCDYGFRVCTDYIVLPKTTKTFPPVDEETSFGCRWVKEKDFISLLETLTDSKK